MHGWHLCINLSESIPGPLSLLTGFLRALVSPGNCATERAAQVLYLGSVPAGLLQVGRSEEGRTHAFLS